MIDVIEIDNYYGLTNEISYYMHLFTFVCSYYWDLSLIKGYNCCFWMILVDNVEGITPILIYIGLNGTRYFLKVLSFW